MHPVPQQFRQLAALIGFGVANLFLFALSSVHAEEEESVRVYKQVSPSVVGLSSAEGSGTGILVSSTGTIITNAHVVTSPLPFKVQIDVAGRDGAVETLTYKNVTIHGYHPTLDLALIKIDLKENPGKTLKSAKLAKEKGAPGQRVYVIGNPAAGGQVLTKSITSGMLSAVDREIEGGAYYQIDAAINPGNSGGPVCDRTGRVLGLVTFKFLDADAVGFAIPLHGIDKNSFVPLSKRRSDPAKARELLQMADKLSAMSREAERTEGPDGETSKLLDLDAAVCYREALLYDASNPAVYYNIGTILRTLDGDEIAIGYLTYSVQLAPWNDPKGDAYRELGLALVKTDKKSAALAAWREGVAKFPYSPKIWEDLAIYHIQHNEPVDAAVAASTALLVAQADTRKDVMQQVVDDAKRAAGESLKKLMKEATDEAIVATLDELLERSNKAREAKKLHVTRDFDAVVDEFGGPPVEGVEDNIPADLLPRLPALASIAPADDGEDAAIAPAADGPPDRLGDDWIGPRSDSSETQPGGTIWPAVTNKKLVKRKRRVVDAAVIDLDVGKVVDVCWSNGDVALSLFVLEEGGLVRKITVANWTEERQINLSTPCSSMAMSNEGLFVAQPTIQDAVLLNSTTLEIKARYPVRNIERIASAPSLPRAYASANQGGSLAIIDGSTPKVQSAVRSADIVAKRGHDLSTMRLKRFAITPDGRKMLCEHDGCLYRFALERLRIVHEDNGPTFGVNPHQVVISPDSKYVAMPSAAGNQDEAHPGRNIFIYKIYDLDKPVCILRDLLYSRTMGFDFKAKLLYAQDSDNQLITFTPNGTMLKEYPLYRRENSPGRILVHPDGRKVLVMAEAGVSWVELPE